MWLKVTPQGRLSSHPPSTPLLRKLSPWLRAVFSSLFKPLLKGYFPWESLDVFPSALLSPGGGGSLDSRRPEEDSAPFPRLPPPEKGSAAIPVTPCFVGSPRSPSPSNPITPGQVSVGTPETTPRGRLPAPPCLPSSRVQASRSPSDVLVNPYPYRCTFNGSPSNATAPGGAGGRPAQHPPGKSQRLAVDPHVPGVTGLGKITSWESLVTVAVNFYRPPH